MTELARLHSSRRNLLHVSKHAFAAALLFALAGCGGGGSSKTLTVNFSYQPNYTYLWRSTELPVTATGLEGNTPVCQLVAGALPRGLSVQSSGCRIVGVPIEVLSSFVTIRLTVPGFEGQVDQIVQIVSLGPSLSYPFLATVPAGNAVSLVASRYADVDALAPSWMPMPNETLTYSVGTGSLPPGLTLSAVTGEISGLTTEAGRYEYRIRAIAVSPSGTYSQDSDNQIFTVARGLRLYYSSIDPMIVGATGSRSPLFEYPFPKTASDFRFENFRLAASSDALPSGLLLDSLTGTISGAPSSVGTFTIRVQVEAVSENKSGTLETTYVLQVTQ